MLYLESPVTDPCFNLALEEYMFEALDPGRTYFMLWQNEAVIFLGKYQRPAEEIDEAYVRRRGLRVVRRLTGGRTVYQTAGSLSYTFIVNRQCGLNFKSRVYTAMLADAFQRLGIPLGMDPHGELTINGLKCSESAQRMSGGRLLHHGHILLNPGPGDEAAVLRRKAPRGTCHSALTPVNQCVSHPISMSDLKEAIHACVHAHVGLEDYRLTNRELAEIQRIRDRKYATQEWNFGPSPVYNMRCEQKLPAGRITAYLNSEGNIIKTVRFSGDFFEGEDVAGLERALEGISLNDDLEAQLKPLNVGSYIMGLTPWDLSRLLRY